MKYKNKAALVEDYERQWEALWQRLESIKNEVDFDERIQGVECDRSVTDILAHVYAWHRLLLNWMRTGPTGTPELPAKGFKWNQTRELNQMLFHQYEELTFQQIRRRIKRSHSDVMKIVYDLDEKKLLEPGNWVWTGKLPLASYLTPNMAGHYRWAIKKLKRFI